jgi:opine dehydrogenase
MTGVAGSLGTVIGESGVADVLKSLLTATAVSLLLLAWLVAAVLRTAQGGDISGLTGSAIIPSPTTRPTRMVRWTDPDGCPRASPPVYCSARIRGRGAPMIISVLGGGNGSHAAVVDLSLRGHEVRWWRRSAPFPDGGRLRYRAFDGSGEVAPALVTHDLAAAVSGSDLVVAPVPAPAQPELLAQLAPLLAPGQAVAFTPGTFGTWLGAQLRPDVVFLETGTLPYLTRVTGPGEVSIPVIASRLPVGSIPGTGPLADNAHAAFAAAYPMSVRVSDGLDAALSNWGPVIHPPLIAHNLGAIESLGDGFDIHAEGTSPSVLATTRALDAERIALREALGLPQPHWPLADYYEGRDTSMYPPDAKARLLASDLWRESVGIDHRYVHEDIRCGLALNVTLARWVGVDAPVGAAILTLVGTALREELLATGRVAAALGADDLHELRRTARDGAAVVER